MIPSFATPPPTSRRVTSAELHDRGFVVLPGVIDPQLQRHLTREAAERQALATDWGTDEYVVCPDGQIWSPRRHLTARPGPHLRRLESAAELRDLLGALAGEPVRPARVVLQRVLRGRLRRAPHRTWPRTAD